MLVPTLLLVALLCLLFESTRGFGLLLFIVLCLINPALLVILMAIGVGIFVYSKSKTTFLPKE